MSNVTVDPSALKDSTVEEASGLRLLGLLLLPLAVAAVLLVLINVLVFRVFNYYYWVEPESVMGNMVHVEGLIDHQIVAGKKNIIVIGDSRVGEGFSAVVANAASQRPDLNFIQSGISGSEPRVWYYLLRKIDPKHTKFAGVVLMASHFDDDHQYFDSSARIDDLTYLQPVTTYKDAWSIASSYGNFDSRMHAFATMMVPLAVAQADIRDVLLHTRKRADKARFYHEHYFEWQLSYPGQSGAMPNLSREQLPTFDFASTGLPPLKIGEMNRYVASVLGHGKYVAPGPYGDYRKKWFGAIADEYDAAKVPVLVFQVPRGPYEAYETPADKENNGGALYDLAREGRLKLLNFAPLAEVEKPQYFVDGLHVNKEGRKLMSSTLAQLIAQQFPAAK